MEIIKFDLKLLTPWLNFYFFIELLTSVKKKEISQEVINTMVKLLFLDFRFINLKNIELHFELLKLKAKRNLKL